MPVVRDGRTSVGKLLDLLAYFVVLGAFAVTPLMLWLGWVVLGTGRHRERPPS
jgi:hypothetical protein